MAKRETPNKSAVFYVKIFFAVVVIVGGAVYMGKSDAGQIDINTAIQNANQVRKDADSNAKNVETVPEEFRNKPNGGLVPQDTAPQAAAEPIETAPSATSTSTSTEESATDI